MKLQRMLIGLVTGVSVVSLGVAGCTQRDFEADAQAPTATTGTQAPAATTRPQERPADVPYVPTSTLR